LGYNAETTCEEGLFDVMDCIGGCWAEGRWVYFQTVQFVYYYAKSVWVGGRVGITD
jgi:hypothetical protein